MTPAPIAPACPFCETLAATDADAVVLADAGDAVAVLDRCPVAPGHVLVIPRRHAASLEELTDVECGAVMSLARDVAGAVRAGLAPAVNLHLSDGHEAEQDVPHVHLHVIPRHEGDGVVIDLPGERPGRHEFERVADGLRAQMGC